MKKKIQIRFSRCFWSCLLNEKEDTDKIFTLFLVLFVENQSLNHENKLQYKHV